MNRPASAIGTNPFPGLRPFRENEEHLFFGREEQVDAMVDKLAETRFLAVVGTSGSGKSSLVNCGLQPALHRGLMVQAGTAWRVARFRPGGDPIGSMTRALARNGVLFRGFEAAGLSLADIVETTLRMSKRGLIDIFEQAAPGEGVNLLVVVDQFEELFRYRQLEAAGGLRHAQGMSEEAAAFVNLLLEVKQTELPIFVVLTMRSDFLGDCTQFPGLVEAVNAGQYLVPRLTRSERRAAIAGPVGVGGAEIAPVLLTRLVNDVGDNPDQLSILQHALNRTWARWKHDGGGEGPLDLSHYQAIGTMAHALDQHAEKAYAELETPREKLICERIFKALTDKATDPRGVRRPTKMGTLCALTDATEAEVTEVIDVFRQPSRSFLMPPAGEALTAETVIDISHESLMRVWRRLDRWADEEERSARTYSRLAETAVLHAAGKASLWRDPDLQLALDWREASQPNETWAARYDPGFAAAMDFLTESREAREAEQAEREEQQRRELEAEHNRAMAEFQAMRARRMRWAAAFSAALAVFAGVSGFMAFKARDVARLAKGKAENQTLLVVATSVSDTDPTAAASLFLELEQADDHPTAWPGMAEVLRSPLSTNVLRHTGPVPSAAFSPDGTRIVTASWDGTAWVWAADGSGEPIVLAGHEGNVGSATFSPDGTRVVTASSDKTVRVWAADGSGEPIVLAGHEGYVYSARFSPDGTRVVTASRDKTARVWAVDGSVWGRPIVLAGHEGYVYSARFSPDGTRVVTASSDNTARVWAAVGWGAGEPIVLAGHRGYVDSAAFSPDGTRVVTASQDNTARIWAADGSVEPIVLAHEGYVYSATFSPDGTRIVTASQDKTARVWAADGSGEPIVLGGHESEVDSATFSPDGTRVVTASLDNTARVWAADGSGEPIVLAGHGSDVGSAKFSPDGTCVVTASWDQTARVWTTDGSGEPIVLTGHRSWVPSASFSPDGNRVVTASLDNTARIWAADGSGEPIVLTGHGADVLFASFSPDGTRVVTASRDRTARIWAADGSGEPIVLTGHGAAVLSASFSPDGTRVVTASEFPASEDGTARVWSVDGSGEHIVLAGHESLVSSASFSPDGTRVVTASWDQTARVWSVDGSGEPIVLAGHESVLSCASFSPDGMRVATASSDNTARIWAADGSGEPIVLTGHRADVRSASFSPGGTRVVTASGDGTARVWEADGSGEPVVLPGDGAVLSAAFSPDGNRVVTSYEDGTARVWAADGSGEPVVLPGDGALSAAFSPNGNRVVTSYEDGTARVWAVSGSALLEAIQAAAPACLTPEFRVRYLGELPEEAQAHYEECRKARLAK